VILSVKRVRWGGRSNPIRTYFWSCFAHNSLKPDLELSGFYSGNGVAGNQFNTAVPPQLIKTTGLGDGLSQSFHFTYPAYGAILSLSLPIKNHNAEANLADATVGRRRDQYQQRRTISEHYSPDQ
jgi:hypothetical protein